MSKVTLTKAAPAVSLSKGGQASGVIRVNLNWSAQAPGAKKGFFSRLTGQDPTDLDLGCLYELSDGTKGVIQALGNSFGDLKQPPHIFLDGDDRSGAVSAGENMFINLERPERFRRILVFALIYSGAANWAAADGVVTLYPQSGPEIEVRLDAADSSARMCAIALIENRGGDVVVQREVKYVNGNQRNLDQAYQWGLDWTPGRK
ncbi:Tellurium resistance [Nakamurella silvestris]|nr:Tellurium resistance [Nakamurella silvestris]